MMQESEYLWSWIVCETVNREKPMKAKKKSAKAVTLLTKAEKLLSDVIDDCVDIEKSVEKNVREVLLSAQASIDSAMNFFTAGPSSATQAKSVKSKAKSASARSAKPKKVAKAVRRVIAPVARKRAVKA